MSNTNTGANGKSGKKVHKVKNVKEEADKAAAAAPAPATAALESGERKLAEGRRDELTEEEVAALRKRPGGLTGKRRERGTFAEQVADKVEDLEISLQRMNTHARQKKLAPIEEASGRFLGYLREINSFIQAQGSDYHPVVGNEYVSKLNAFAAGDIVRFTEAFVATGEGKTMALNGFTQDNQFTVKSVFKNSDSKISEVLCAVEPVGGGMILPVAVKNLEKAPV